MSYTTQEAIIARFGNSDVIEWSDLSGEGELNETAIADAIERAEAYIDAVLEDGPYAVPFTTAPRLIASIATSLAGVYLYEMRGVQDIDPASGQTRHRLTFIEDRARRELDQIRGGKLRLGSANNRVASSVPRVVEPKTIAEELSQRDGGGGNFAGGESTDYLTGFVATE